MRIERVRWIGDQAACATFQFPDAGVALWASGNDVREDALLQTLATALYGPSADAPLPAGVRSIEVGLRLDDGTTLRVERSVETGALQLEGDVDRFDPVAACVELGVRLLALSREDFLAIAAVNLDGLRGTRGDLRLRTLLSDGRTGASATAVNAADETPPAAPRRVEADLPIVRAELDELRAESSVPTGPLETVAIERASAAPDESAEGEASSPVDQVRRTRRRLAELDMQLELLTQQLREVADQREEFRVDGDRCGMLSGMEPQDLDRLVSLTEELSVALEQRAAVLRARQKFEADLEARGFGAATLADLKVRFAPLDAEDAAFLEAAEQRSTIRRGNLALTRSECRLDETRLEEIERARTAAVRAGLLPWIGATLGIFGSLAMFLLGVSPLVSGLVLVVGLLAGGAAGWLTWRARTLREDERAGIVDAMERKRGQLSELEEESAQHDRRAKELSAQVKAASIAQLRADWKRWRESEPVARELATFVARETEAENRIVTLRGKLSAFRIDDGDGEADLGNLLALIEEYQRYFQSRRELNGAEQECARIEAELMELETGRADALATFEALLASVGIDPDRDLDEAVEMFVLRTRYAEGFAGETPDEPGRKDELPAAPAVPSPAAEPERAFDTAWIPAVSAATEANLRRFLPEVRDVEVDADLEPSLRLDVRGPRLDLASLERTLSAAAMDQVWLALRLAIRETLSSGGERVPLFLDDPWARADDSRHVRGLEWSLDASDRGQVVYRTSHEVRVKWFLHQFAAHRTRITSIVPSSARAPSDASVVRPPLPASR